MTSEAVMPACLPQAGEGLNPGKALPGCLDALWLFPVRAARHGRV